MYTLPDCQLVRVKNSLTKMGSIIQVFDVSEATTALNRLFSTFGVVNSLGVIIFLVLQNWFNDELTRNRKHQKRLLFWLYAECIFAFIQYQFWSLVTYDIITQYLSCEKSIKISLALIWPPLYCQWFDIFCN